MRLRLDLIDVINVRIRVEKAMTEVLFHK